MTISYHEGLRQLIDLNQRIYNGLPSSGPTLFDEDEGNSLQFSNSAMLIEHLLARTDAQSIENAKEIAELLDLFLREGDAMLVNDVAVSAIEAFSVPSELRSLTTDDIAVGLPPVLRDAYRKQMQAFE